MHQPYKNPTDKRIAKRIAEGHEGGNTQTGDNTQGGTTTQGGDNQGGNGQGGLE